MSYNINQRGATFWQAVAKLCPKFLTWLEGNAYECTQTK